MAKDVQDTIREVLTHAVGEATKNLNVDRSGKSGGPLSGMKGIAAGAGVVALAPLAAKGVGKLAKTVGVNGLGDIAKAPGKAVGDATSKLGDSVGSSISDKVSDKVDEA